MTKGREQVCLHYMGFGLCAKGLCAGETGYCARCSKYQPSGIKNGKANGIRCFSSPAAGQNRSL